MKKLTSIVLGWTLFLSTGNGGLDHLNYRFSTAKECAQAFEQLQWGGIQRFVSYYCVPDGNSLNETAIDKTR